MAPHIQAINSKVDDHKRKGFQRLMKGMLKHFKQREATEIKGEIEVALKKVDSSFEDAVKKEYLAYQAEVEVVKKSHEDITAEISQSTAKILNASERNTDMFLRGVKRITHSTKCNIDRDNQLASLTNFERLRVTNLKEFIGDRSTQLMEKLGPALTEVYKAEQSFNKKIAKLVTSYKHELRKTLKEVLAPHLKKKKKVLAVA